MKRVIRYFQSPAFSDADWTSRNPLLLQGEIGYLTDNTGNVINAKVGPGLWNDLPYLTDKIYNYPDTVSNPIGDATGVLQGDTVTEILYKMLNPYQVPAVVDLQNNAGGTVSNVTLLEVGQTLTGSVLLSFGINNLGNLSGANPVTVAAGSTFSNEGNFPATSPISMILGGPLTPTGLTTIEISMTLTHLNGTTTAVKTYIYFRPRIIWTNSTAAVKASLTGFSSWSSLVTAITQHDYSFSGTGYAWIAIPSMLNPPANLVCTEISNPSAPTHFDFENQGTQVISNGVGNYQYTLYRSTYYLTESSILRIS